MSDSRLAALVIIDLQNDFLGPNAHFSVGDQAQVMLRETLERLVPDFRSSGGHVIWIKSHYALATKEWKDKVNLETSTDSDVSTPGAEAQTESINEQGTYERLKWVVEGTHIGKRACCQEGTPAAELAPWAQDLVHSNDSIVIKTYYSAFKVSQLRSTLEEKGIKDIYLAGLLSNMCVLATALYGVRLATELGNGWNIYTVVDALAWRNEKSHLKALETMEQQGVHLITSEGIISES